MQFFSCKSYYKYTNPSLVNDNDFSNSSSDFIVLTFSESLIMSPGYK